MDQVQTAIVFELLKFGAYLQRTGDRVLRPYGISQQEFTVLSALARERGAVPQSSLVVDLLVEHSNLSKIVKRLEGKGLVDVQAASADRRVRLLAVTRNGLALYERANRALTRWNKRWMAHLGPDELLATRAHLAKLRAGDT